MDQPGDGSCSNLSNRDLPQYTNDRQFARSLDHSDPLAKFRSQFHIPSKRSLSGTKLTPFPPDDDASPDDTDLPGIYLCGHQIGLQPRQTAHLVQQHLATWAQQGMYGLAKTMDGSPLPTWGEADRVAAGLMAPLVGASADEVAVMGGLTANLHAMMASFYVPDRAAGRTKIIMEGGAFSSDCFAITSHLTWHSLPPSGNLILIPPANPCTGYLSTADILSTLTQHASSTALVLLSGVQYLTGQVLDMARITAHAHALGIPAVGWDLAHAVGNVELRLHEWGVNFAVWCNYKFVNGGPGAIAGAFVHGRHGGVDKGEVKYRPRLAGWWGHEMATRFSVRGNEEFVPSAGAAGYQMSNASVLDTVALIGSLNVFKEAGMEAIWVKSWVMKGYLDYLLLGEGTTVWPFEPMCADVEERGAQLSLRFEDKALLDRVVARLRGKGIVVAQSRDVLRVAPVPLYNTFDEIWEFADEFKAALVDCTGENV